MNAITPETSVAEIVRATPARSRLFEHLGLDYCCGGQRPLAEACRAKGLDPATVVAMLSALEGAPSETVTDPARMAPAELCDHIEQVHHRYLREELPRLDFLTRKVAATHGAEEPRLLQVRQLFETFEREITAHMQEEDQTVFPAIRQWDAVAGPHPAPETLQAALAKLETEHDRAGAALAQFKSLTDNYTPPEWACNSFRALYDGLAGLEKDMHQHVHKENNVLFPKVRAMTATRNG
jgi:regulator of cell morphogenesis and NO signaling